MEPGGPAESTEAQLAETAADVEKSRIVTTEKELDCYAVVREILAETDLHNKTILDPSTKKELPPDVEYKDTTGYFGIYLNKPSWWALRIVADARKPWVGFNIDPEAGQELVPAGFNRLSPHPFAGFRVGFQEPGDLVKLRELIVASFEKTISDRRN